MKKKFLLFVFLLVSCFAISIFSHISNVSYAESNHEISFEIKNSSLNKLEIECIELDLSVQVNSWNEALQLIKANSTSEEVIYVNFNNLDLDNFADKSLNFNFDSSLILSGHISSNDSEPVFILDTNQNLTLQNLTIDLPNAQNIVSFAGEENLLVFANNIIYTNYNNDEQTYLVEYKSGNSITANEPTANLKIFVSSFELENELIISINKTYNDFVKLYYLESDVYFNTSNYSNSLGGIIVTSYINFGFNLNGGIYENFVQNHTYNNETGNYDIPYPYGTYSSGLINFENQGTPKRGHATYDGIFGLIQTNEQIYYFDLEMLKNYVDAGENFDDISNFFTTSLKEVNNDYSIKYYTSFVKTSIEYYKHFEIFKKNNIAPIYILKWTVEEYDIDFVTDTDKQLQTLTLEYGQRIPEFEELTKKGYDFAGWYTNSNKTQAFKSAFMPANNLTLYAKWTASEFELEFETNGGTIIEAQTYQYGSQIQRPEDPSKEGYDFVNWYEDKNFENIFEFGTMPANNVKIYAKWQIKKFSIFLNSNVTNSTRVITGIEYGSQIPELNTNSEVGYSFDGLFTDKTYETEFDLNQLVTGNIYIYAKYTAIEYEVEFVNNYDLDNELPKIVKIYREQIELPKLSRTNYIFSGWFYDNETFEEECTINSMPARNLILFAKWTLKNTVKLELTPQTYYQTDAGLSYINETGLSNLIIYYLVDEEWTTLAPSDVGTYDVRIVRNEDENYLALDIVLENGFSIVQRETNIVWLIALLYIATIVEIIVSLVARIMLKRKLSSTYVLIGSIAVSTSQFVNLIISGLMCLAGFVYMTYQLVILTRSLNNENFAPSKEDNRQRFKEDLKFQTDSKNKELDFETKTKTNESFGDKYSDEDIEKLLNNDDFTQKIKNSRGKFAEISYDEENASIIYSQNLDSGDEEISEDNKLSETQPLEEASEDYSQNIDLENENIMPKLHFDIEEEKNNLNKDHGVDGEDTNKENQ